MRAKVYKDKTQWRLDFYCVLDGQKLRTRTKFITKEEANKKKLELESYYVNNDLIRLKKAINNEFLIADENKPLTISELYEQYLTDKVKNKNTRRDRKTIWNKYLKGFYKDLTIEDIDRNMMSRLRDELTRMKTPKGNVRNIAYEEREREPVPEARQRSIWRVNKSFISWAIESSYIEDNNYFAGIADYKKEIAQLPAVWELEEFKKFISVVKDEREKGVFVSLYLCGFRKSELRGLKFKDVDFNKDIIKVSMQLYGSEYKATKNRKIREVNMPKIVKDYILKSKQYYLDMGMSERQIQNEYCFVNKKGNPISTTSLERHFNKYVEESGVKRINIHSLRHSYVTNMLMFGCSPTYVASQSGHTVETMMKYYASLTSSDKEKAVAGINNSSKLIFENNS